MNVFKYTLIEVAYSLLFNRIRIKLQIAKETWDYSCNLYYLLNGNFRLTLISGNFFKCQLMDEEKHEKKAKNKSKNIIKLDFAKFSEVQNLFNIKDCAI